ncbi:hypothetical protein T265_11107 [Opisthorchis viverrini]|uniref:Secreted protein n=1 Tax=Opisthorchis viverrini TaxID=6198 RepID=A0A074YZV7_OPIVI|nr:hypothetical protein T265_11107 [Opisthorchis viverrini]KER20326.1 hypothetical protein T265_11107 [Opisthorchis viverrini]
MLLLFISYAILVFVNSFQDAQCEELEDVGLREHVHSITGARWISRRLFESDGLIHTFGAKRETAVQKAQRPTVKHVGFDDTRIPKNFDARKAWPHCSSISEIRDQSSQ